MKDINPQLFNTAGFKLISLELISNKILGDKEIDFLGENKSLTSLHTTVLIGPNGTKKSLLLRTLIDLFKELNNLILNGERTNDVSGKFSLKYANQSNIYEFTNISKRDRMSKFMLRAVDSNGFYNSVYLYQNGKEVSFHQKYPVLPQTLIANSLMITDKFPVLINDEEREKFPIYNYLGVKSNRQQASINSYTKRTIKQIVDNNPNESFYSSLGTITEFLELDKRILISYEIQNQSHFWNPKLGENEIEGYFNDSIQRYRKREKSPPYSVTNYQNLKNKGLDMSELIHFREKVFRNGRFDKSFSDSKKKGLQYEIINPSEYHEFQEDHKSLDILRKIGFLKSPKLLFSKSDKGFELSNGSSGQQHFFSTIIGLMATIKPSSLVLIDEPETSLHPNWQMRYLEFIYQLFDNEVFSSCHFVVATHSHFLISDLDGKKGSIIGLKANGEIKPVKNNTYGWSAEQVLLDIFEVPTTRNRYIADKIGKILQLIAKKTDDRETITKKVNELVELNLNNLSSNDPLYPIWKKILDKYGTRS